MRQAGTIATRQDAERFANYLLALGITTKVDRAGEQWAIWVHDENDVPRSKQELEQFERAPQDPRYDQAEQAAKQARREAADKVRQARKNYIDMRNEWASPWRRRPVTIVMIAFSVALALGVFGNLGVPDDLLMFSWPDILAGQAWRLITPIFLHGGPLHLIFNMWMLFDLGTLIERRLGSVRYAALVLVVAVFSNMAQAIVTGPNFLGMSGVVFGLFGYAWVRGRLDPTCGLYLRPDLVYWIMGWFVLCAVGVIGNVANWAHGGGLVAGAVLGFLAHRISLLRQHR
ncbi:MAG: rhomboid family intramembrane serine protease [Pirellulales bacterium]